jgi:hypothetical protein
MKAFRGRLGTTNFCNNLCKPEALKTKGSGLVAKALSLHRIQKKDAEAVLPHLEAATK